MFESNKSKIEKWKKLKQFISSWAAILLRAILVLVIAVGVQYLSEIIDGSYTNINSLFISCFVDNIKDTFTIVLAIGILSKPINDILKKFARDREEEKRKIEPDQHLIIREHIDYDEKNNVFKRENEHADKDFQNHKNYYDDIGMMMTITKLNKKDSDNLNLSNKPKNTDEKIQELAINNFINQSILNIANINVFTNINGKTKLIVNNDTSEYHPLDVFIESNRMALLGAHNNKENNDTIRLDNFIYKNNSLKVDLSRTTYFDMLTTNRALDYPIGETTLRKFYEYRKYLTPLKESKLSNQIGITGVILSKDGYVLYEDRNRKKSTWQNKFGPSISFSLKEDYLVKKHSEKLSGKSDVMGSIVKAIENSIKNNFGFTKDDFYPIVFEKNFMGVARDILEGGKPNFYFFAQLNINAIEATIKMQKNAAIENGKEKLVVINEEKLINKYLFTEYNKFNIDYYYCLICDSDTIKIGRKYSPRFSYRSNNPEKINNIVFSKRKEVAEGLLACMAYLEIILKYGNKNQERIITDGWK